MHGTQEISENKNAYGLSFQQIQNFLELAGDGIFEVSLEGLVQATNCRFAEMLGYRETEIIGKRVTDLVSPDEITNSLRKDALDDQLPFKWKTEWNLKKENGHYLPVEISARLFPDSVVRGFVRDISCRKKQEQQNLILAELGRTLGATTDYKKRIQLVADLVVPSLADFCIVSILEDGEFRFKAIGIANESLRESLESLNSHADSEGDFRFSIPHVVANQKPLLIEDVTAALIDDAHSFGPELAARLKTFAVNSYAIIPMLCRNEIIGALTFYSTNSQRKLTPDELPFLEIIAARCATGIENAKLYAEAIRATKARETVLSIVSHDLRNPLSIIDLSAQMFLDRQYGGPQNIESAMNRIRRSVVMMQQLISDLLDFSKTQAGTFSIEKSQVSVKPFIFIALESLAEKAKLKNQKLVVRCPEEDVRIFADERRLVQVIWNLVGNAIKFSDEGIEIAIEAKFISGQLQVSVTDAGPGLKANEFSKVFDLFWQAEKTAELGTGLGLAICKGIVEAHKGKIWVEANKTKGCEFIFTIPV